MKLKEIFYGLGLKPPTREYPFRINHFRLPGDGEVDFAQWQHPVALRWSGELTQDVVDEARRYIQPGDTVIDVGAHSGDSTLPLALAAGPTGIVFALEPNPYPFNVLLANAGLNKRRTNIYPLMFAATSEDGEYEFDYSDAGFCNGGLHEGVSRWKHASFFTLRVQGRNLERYLEREFPREAERLRFIKIDTEGSDRRVVASLAALIRRTRPYIRSEIFRHTPDEERRGYWRDLRELGYRIHRYESDRSYKGEELGENDLMRWPHYDIFAVPA